MYFRLTAIADRTGDTVEGLLTSFAILRSRVDGDPVVQLVGQGLTDREIARSLGLMNHVIAARRRRAGLPANRRPRGAEISWKVAS